MNNIILILLVLFPVKHFLADFPLQTPYMLKKGKGGFEWILPLGAHCAVHAVMSWMIILFVRPEMAYLAVIEFFAHFIIDRIKATYRLPAGTWANEEKGKYLSKYYYAFGLDQLMHQLTYVAMIYLMLK